MVGADGATHCGAFDVTYMASLPNMVVMAPSNEAELINMVGMRASSFGAKAVVPYFLSCAVPLLLFIFDDLKQKS